MTPQLYIMVKEPRPGRVKTRLGRDIGTIPATWWFRHQTRRLIRRLSADPRWQTVLAVSPDHAGMHSRIWPSHLPRFAQGGGDLGDRMGRALRSPVAGPVLVIGADIPGITPRHIADAFKALGDHDAVLGPAPDGGYWLIGLKNARPAPRDLFKDVRWSSEFARADTQKSLGGLSCAMVAELQDVDRATDLATVAAP